MNITLKNSEIVREGKNETLISITGFKLPQIENGKATLVDFDFEEPMETWVNNRLIIKSSEKNALRIKWESKESMPFAISPTNRFQNY